MFDSREYLASKASSYVEGNLETFKMFVFKSLTSAPKMLGKLP